MLTERFKKYLEAQFRLISPTREAMEYRQEVLQNLLDRAHEYTIKGMTDEDAIFDLCIDSLGDFKSTLTDFENRLDNLKKAAPKIGAIALSVIASILFVVIVYLTVSFATHAWAKTWLIPVCAVFVGIIALAVTGIIKASKRNKHFLIRLYTQAIIVSLSVMLFLILQILVSLKYSWFVFLVMVMAIFISDTAEAYLLNSKLKLLSLLLTIEIVAVMIYVILGIASVITWHPYWLIPVVAVVVDIAVLVVGLLSYSKKKEKKESDEKARLKEEYYTMWNDEK